jgi:hypothetical protein
MARAASSLRSGNVEGTSHAGGDRLLWFLHLSFLGPGKTKGILNESRLRTVFKRKPSGKESVGDGGVCADVVGDRKEVSGGAENLVDPQSQRCDSGRRCRPKMSHKGG